MTIVLLSYMLRVFLLVKISFCCACHDHSFVILHAACILACKNNFFEHVMTIVLFSYMLLAFLLVKITFC